MCAFLAELNKLVPHATDIGDTCLEATTREKVCIEAGLEFKEREGHLLITVVWLEILWKRVWRTVSGLPEGIRIRTIQGQTRNFHEKE